MYTLYSHMQYNKKSKTKQKRQKTLTFFLRLNKNQKFSLGGFYGINLCCYPVMPESFTDFHKRRHYKCLITYTDCFKKNTPKTSRDMSKTKNYINLALTRVLYMHSCFISCVKSAQCGHHRQYGPDLPAEYFKN